MIPELIVYNYQTNKIKQNDLLESIRDFLNYLRENGIETDFLRLVDGNSQYPQQHRLIDEVLQYWGRKSRQLSIVCIYQSLLFLYRYLNKWDLKNYGYFIVNGALLPKEESQQIAQDLTAMLNGDMKPAFFNSIIITGDRYLLEAPYGVALETILNGGICLNANIHQYSIWHETAHLLGAGDHYDEQKNYQSVNCDDPSACWMQWNALLGNKLCKNSLREIKSLLTKTKETHPIIPGVKDEISNGI